MRRFSDTALAEVVQQAFIGHPTTGEVTRVCEVHHRRLVL
jgi:hypothetical protein